MKNGHLRISICVYTCIYIYIHTHCNTCICTFISVQFSRSVVSDSLRPHESQHARPPCLSPTPGVHTDSRPWSQWCHQAISSSVVPFSSCPQSLPASESFPMSQLFVSIGILRYCYLYCVISCCILYLYYIIIIDSLLSLYVQCLCYLESKYFIYL